MTNLEQLKIMTADQKLLAENIKVLGTLPRPEHDQEYREAIDRYHTLSQQISLLLTSIASGEIDGKATYTP
jgi:hypothetical protein